MPANPPLRRAAPWFGSAAPSEANGYSAWSSNDPNRNSRRTIRSPGRANRMWGPTPHTNWRVSTQTNRWARLF